MEINILLHKLIEQQSSDGTWMRLNMFAENGDVARVDLLPEDLARLGAHLTEMSLKSEIAGKLPNSVKIETHSQALAIHDAAHMKVVRWEGGGFALQVQDREGADLQIRFTPEMVMSLHEALDRQYPKSRAARGES